MRNHPLRRLKFAPWLCLCGLLMQSPPAIGSLAGQAKQPDAVALQVTIIAPPRLAVDARTAVEIRVTLPDGMPVPVMLTPIIEGPAVEAVRGRLLRSDAKDPKASELIFMLPIAVRSEGTSVLRVRVVSYLCRPRCRAIHGVASQVLQAGGGS